MHNLPATKKTQLQQKNIPVSVLDFHQGHNKGEKKQ